MPCRTDDDGDLHLEELRRNLNEVTAHLCSVMKHAESKHPWLVSQLSKNVQDWWTGHKKWDKERKRREEEDKAYEQRLRQWESNKPRRP